MGFTIKQMLVLLIILLLCACGNRSSTDPDPNAPPDAAGGWYKPPVSATWQWQLSGSLNAAYDVAIYDIDLFDTSQALIQEMQAGGRRVICYFSAGSYENWRSDAGQFKAADLAVSYTHLTLPTTIPSCRYRWAPYQ